MPGKRRWDRPRYSPQVTSTTNSIALRPAHPVPCGRQFAKLQSKSLIPNFIAKCLPSGNSWVSQRHLKINTNFKNEKICLLIGHEHLSILHLKKLFHQSHLSTLTATISVWVFSIPQLDDCNPRHPNVSPPLRNKVTLFSAWTTSRASYRFHCFHWGQSLIHYPQSSHYLGIQI